MECKDIICAFLSGRRTDWNITRMECKEKLRAVKCPPALNWNITRMECKDFLADRTSAPVTILEYNQNGM